MTQEQYVMIVKCIQHGAAAIADDLITSLNNMINACKSYERKLRKTTKEVKEEN